MRGLKVRTREGMVVLSADEATALMARLADSEAARAAGGTFSVSANASTSVTFTDAEKAAVLDVLTDWLGPTSGDKAETGLAALQSALAREVGAR